jgi:hypothetical protein
VTRPLIVLAGLTALALALRALEIDQSLFGDELYAYYEVQGRSFGDMMTTVYEGPEVTPHLFFILAWATAKLGDPTIWVRLPSLVCGVLLVPATYALGALTVGRRAALFGAAIVTLAPFAIFYSVEARPYATLALATTLSTIALSRALDDGRKAWWAAYALASLAAMYTHLTAVFVLAAQAAWAAYAHRDKLFRLVGVNVAAAVLFLPWVPRLFRDDLAFLVSTYGPFTARPRELGAVLGHVLPGYPFVPFARLPGIPAAALFVAGVVAAVAVGLRRRRPPAVLVVPMLAVPAGLILYGALSSDGIFTPRTSITMLPYAALVLGALVMAMPRAAGAATLVVMLGSLSVGTLRAMGDDGQRPRYREAAEYIADRARPGDAIVEQELFPDLGPWRVHFAIYAPPGLPYYRRGFDDPEPADRIFYVSVPTALPAPETIDGLVPGERRRFEGIHPVDVTTYVRPQR